MASEHLGSGRQDALQWYQRELESKKLNTTYNKVETLKSLYTLLTGLGALESAGNHTVGYDRNVKRISAVTAEAGLFQTSFNSLAFSPELATLYLEYRARPARCFLNVFNEGIPELRQGIVGTPPAKPSNRYSPSSMPYLLIVDFRRFSGCGDTAHWRHPS